MYCNTNIFSALLFYGPYSKTQRTRGLSKSYHVCFDPKVDNGVCAIVRIPCACVACTSMIYKPWISGIPSYGQERFITVTNCTYWPVLGSFNNWKIILFSQKSTPFDAFDEIKRVVLDGISYNMASLVESGKYEAIKKCGDNQ